MEYVCYACGKTITPQKSIAPRDWFLADKGKIGRGQMFLFEQE